MKISRFFIDRPIFASVLSIVFIILGGVSFIRLPIAQLSFMTLDKPARRPYGSAELGSHYQGQRAATESRYEGLAGKPSDRGRTKIG